MNTFNQCFSTASPRCVFAGPQKRSIHLHSIFQLQSTCGNQTILCILSTKIQNKPKYAKECIMITHAL